MTPPNSVSSNADIATEIRRLGRNFNPEILKATYALYAPLQQRAPKGGVEIHKDQAYGDDERHRLDMFVPAKKPASPSPIVVYFHGGGYVAGERSPLPGLIYDNVPTFFARNGIIGANATYRLAPQHKWPAGAADVGMAVEWLRKNAARFGGDPERVFAMGQSAGATHVSTWTFMDQVHGAHGPRIAGAILLSGVYAPRHPEFSPERPAENSIAYYGTDETRWISMSPIFNVKPGHPPVLIAVAEYDPYPLAWSSAALAAVLVKCDRKMPWFIFNRNHNHVSPAMQINSAVNSLGPELLEFVRSAS